MASGRLNPGIAWDLADMSPISYYFMIPLINKDIWAYMIFFLLIPHWPSRNVRLTRAY